jgi:hypothetical protein
LWGNLDYTPLWSFSVSDYNNQIMISRKQFLYNSTLVGLGLLASPLGAAGTNEVLNERETAELDATLKQMSQGFSVDQTSYARGFQPKRVISRVEDKKGYKTSFRAVNGSTVVLENFGTAVTRFYS